MRILLAAAALALTACENQSAVPEGDPRAAFETGAFGKVWREDAIVHASGAAAWAQQAIADYERVGPNAAPGRIELLDTSSCLMAKPAPGAKVRHVIVERGAGEPPLFQIGATARGAGADRLRVVNAVITDKSAPIHLVLASESNVIWNLLPAPGVTISAVAAISGGGVGIAGVPDGVEVQALYGEALSRCEITPARRPQEDWAFTRQARSGSGPQREAFAARLAQADAYDAWFRKWYGAPAEKDAIAQMGAGAVLIGPLPQDAKARVPMRSLAGATVQMSMTGRLVIGSEEDYLAAASTATADAAPRS